MSDLISREEVIKLIQQYHGYMPNNINHEMYKKANEIPTAYDVDRVIKRISNDKEHTIYGCINKYEAIEIIKEGVVKE